MNHLDFALLYDDPDAIEGLQLGLFGVRARRTVAGLQPGLFFNDTTDLRGVQLGALANVTRAYAEERSSPPASSEVARRWSVSSSRVSARTRAC